MSGGPGGLHVYSRHIVAARQGQPLEVHGDGKQTRDFTYVSNVVDAKGGAVNHRPIIEEYSPQFLDRSIGPGRAMRTSARGEVRGSSGGGHANAQPGA